MGHRTYDDFELRISRDGAAYRARATGAGRPLGFTLDADAIAQRSAALADAFAGQSRVGPEQLRAVEALGEELFRAVFRGRILRSWGGSLARARACLAPAGVRLVLHLDEVAELSRLPWELLFDRDDRGFIALSTERPIVRHPEFAHLATRPLATTLPLRLLVVLSEPLGEKLLDLEGELRAIVAEIEPLVQNDQATIDVLYQPTLEALRNHVRRTSFHVLHYVGHARNAAEFGDGELTLEQERTRRSEPVRGSQLATIVADARELRLVVLNACDGAATPAGEDAACIALRVAKQGVPAVVAMQTSIGDRAAKTFARAFYREIAGASPLEEAIAEARRALEAAHCGLAWAAPVLYLRTPTGCLIKPTGCSKTPKPTSSVPSRSQGWQRVALGAAVVLLAGALVLPKSLRKGWLAPPDPPPTLPPTVESHPACPSPPGLDLSFALLASGEFEMGAPEGRGDRDNERPSHVVRITRGFCVGRFEVTEAQWTAVTSGGNVRPQPGGSLPKVGVSWDDIQQFLKDLNRRDPAANYRLLTDAEWEYAARGGSSAAYWFGDREEELPIYANCLGENDRFPGLAPVGSFPHNRFGLFDFHGNAQEWVADRFGPYSPTGRVQTDPQGPQIGSDRVRRGGSFEMKAENCASWSRGRSQPSRRGNDFGFRIARSPVGSASRSGTAGSPEPADAARSDRRGDDSHHRIARPPVRKPVASELVEKDKVTSPVGSEPAWPPLSINAGLDQIAQAIADNIKSYGRKRIAVIPFSWTDGRKTNFEEHLAGALTSRLSKIPTLNLVERSLSAETLKELELAKSQNLEQEQTRKLGRLIQAEILLTGDLTELHDVIDVNTRLIDTETGRLYPSPSTKIFIDEAVRRLMESKPTAPPASASPSATDISRRGFLGR